MFTVVQLQDLAEEAKAIAAEEKEEAQAREEAQAEAIAEEEKQRRAQFPEAFSGGQAACGKVCPDHLFNAGCADASDTKTVYAHVCLLQNLHLVFVLIVGCVPCRHRVCKQEQADMTLSSPQLATQSWSKRYPTWCCS